MPDGPFISGKTDSGDRKVPFQVLCVGMCRTGTQSLADALEMLGFGAIYHMREVRKNGHTAMWIAALEAKFEGKGKEFGKEEWDELMGGFGGTSDIPSAFFATELAATYPTAHIIHTTRPFASWQASMRRTLWASQSRRLETMAANPDDPIDPDWRLANTYWRVYWENDFEKTGEAKWREHEAAMLKLKEEGRKFLEFSIGMGFEELCGFLGKEVPRGEDGKVLEFPNHDDARPAVAPAVAGTEEKK